MREKMQKMRWEKAEREEEGMRMKDEEFGPVDQSPFTIDSLPPS